MVLIQSVFNVSEKANGTFLQLLTLLLFISFPPFPFPFGAHTPTHVHARAKRTRTHRLVSLGRSPMFDLASEDLRRKIASKRLCAANTGNPAMRTILGGMHLSTFWPRSRKRWTNDCLLPPEYNDAVDPIAKPAFLGNGLG